MFSFVGGVDKMATLKVIVQIIYVLVCIALVIIVLRQEGKTAGLSGALTGSSDTYWAKNKGRSMEGNLERITKYLAAAFMVLSVVLNLNIW
jgi:preprotein translocase subunit SecG